MPVSSQGQGQEVMESLARHLEKAQGRRQEKEPKGDAFLLTLTSTS